MKHRYSLEDMVAHGVTHRTWDDSYVVFDSSYHIPKGIEEFQELWDQVNRWAKENPDKVKEESPQPIPSEEERLLHLAASLRYERDRRITATDYLIMPDYSGIDEVTRVAWVAYRQSLRELPQQEGFPWDGGGSSTPWPIPPAKDASEQGVVWKQ